MRIDEVSLNDGPHREIRILLACGCELSEDVCEVRILCSRTRGPCGLPGLEATVHCVHRGGQFEREPGQLEFHLEESFEVQNGLSQSDAQFSGDREDLAD